MFTVPLWDRPIEGLLLVQVYTMVPPVVGELKFADTDWPLQTTRFAMRLTDAVGLTVMVKFLGVPEQVTPPFSKLGVTVMVAVTGAEPLLVAWNDGIWPVPLAPRPIEVLVLLQAYVTVPPVALEVKLVAAVLLPLQAA